MKLNYKLVSLLHLSATTAMCAVIWIVQLAHYPSFEYIDAARFPLFEVFHQEAITIIVLPLMLLEITTYGLLYQRGQREIGFLISGLIILVLWLSTFLIQTPIHQQLQSGFNTELIAELIKTNWIRTIGWSLRFLFILRLSLRN